jgi:hypothetical protein
MCHVTHRTTTVKTDTKTTSTKPTSRFEDDTRVADKIRTPEQNERIREAEANAPDVKADLVDRVHAPAR